MKLDHLHIHLTERGCEFLYFSQNLQHGIYRNPVNEHYISLPRFKKHLLPDFVESICLLLEIETPIEVERILNDLKGK